MNDVLYEDAANADWVGAINTTTYQITAIPMPHSTSSGYSCLTGITYVPQHNQIWVDDQWVGIQIINATTDALAGTIPLQGSVCSGPLQQLQYDPDNKEVYALNGTLTAINVTSQTATVVPSNSSFWYSAAYVPTAHAIYGLRTGSGGTILSEVNATNHIIANLSGTLINAANYWPMTFDPVDQSLYFTYLCASSCGPGVPSTGVSAINTTSNTVWGPVGVPGAAGVVYSTASNRLFAADDEGGFADTSIWRVNPISGSATAQVVGFESTAEAFVPSLNELYIANTWGGSVISIMNASTHLIVANISLGSGQPNSLAYDATTGTVYVGSSTYATGSAISLAAINVTTRTLTSVFNSSTCGCSVYGLTVDPSHNRLYASNGGGVSIVNTTTNTMLGSASSNGSFSVGVAYVPQDGAVFITNFNSNNVTVLNTSTGRIVGTVNVGSQPSSIFYDPDNGQVYVANVGSGNVSVINAATYRVSSTISGFYFLTPGYGAYTGGVFGYDAVHHRVYITNQQEPVNLATGNLTVLNSTTGAILGWTASAFGAYAVVCDPLGDQCFISNEGAGSISILTPPLTAVSLTSASNSLTAGGNATFYATSTCTAGTCPPGSITYSWTLNNSLGSLNSTTGASVNFTAGHTAGLVSVTVTATMGGKNVTNTTVITITSLPTLSAVSVSPLTGTLGVGASANFTATSTCTGGSGACPTGTTYSWSLNSTLATLSPTTGLTVKLTAGNAAGIVTLYANATLGGITKEGSATITISSTPVPILASVAITPVTPSVAAGGSQVFTATQTCSGGNCPTGTAYTWSLSNAAFGTLSGVTGSTTTFTAGSKTGTATLTVTATLNGKIAKSSTTITVRSKSPSTGFLGLSGNLGYILVGVIAAVAVVAVAALFLLRKKPRPSEQVKTEKKETPEKPATEEAGKPADGEAKLKG